MKKIFFTLTLFLSLTTVSAQRVTDRLDRGVIAMKVSGGVYLNWRILADEYYGVTYNVYRDGVLLNDKPLAVSNFTDKGGTTTARYTVAPVVKGVEQSKSKEVQPWNTSYKEVRLQHEGIASTLIPNDATCADVDGDGELEIIMKFDNLSEMEQSYPRLGPTVNGKVTGEYSIFECFKLDGTRLWWINCGPNMGDFQNNEQNIALYDWDGDGRAEAVMRACDGTVIHMADGTTYTVGNASANVRGATGGGVNWFVITQNEYLVYLDGLTGKPYQVLTYPLPLLESGENDVNAAWGDGYGHRASKHFFGAPYLDGHKPSIFLARGIYTRHKMIAYDVDSATHKLSVRWRWTCNTNGPWKGNGYHNYAIADVDIDGRDEIVFGSMVIDDNGKGLSTTGYGHGDAESVGDLNPYTHGLEIYACMEDRPGNNYRDATTSKVYHRYQAGKDDGRAMAGNFTNDFPGGLGCSAREGAISTVTYGYVNGLSATGVNTNFRIYWDGDLCSETFNYRDGKNTEGVVAKYGSWTPIYIMEGSMTNNDTKGTPCFQGDILGDWREEVIMRTSNPNVIRIYSTPTATTHRITSLWYDHQYRNSVVWQMNGYNQPPNVSYFLGELEGITMAPPPLTMTGRQQVKNGGTIDTQLNGQHAIVCEDGDAAVTIAEGAQPDVLTLNVPSWVQGTAPSECTTQNTKINYNIYTLTVNGAGLSGSSRLVKQGEGILQLPKSAFTHSGGTDIWEGTLNFDGQMKQSALWLNRHTTLTSNGGEFLSIRADYGSTILPGGANGQGSIAVDTLALNFGSRLQLDVYSDGNAADIVKTKVLKLERKTGSAWTQGGPKYLMPVIELVGHLADGQTKMAAGKYTILEADSIVGSISNIVIEGIGTSKKKLLVEDNKVIVEIIDGREAGTVFWSGLQNVNWENSELENFTIGSQQEATSFISGDDVVFNDDAAKRSVVIVGDLYPASFTVDNTQSYTFSGDGHISGNAQFIKEGSGTIVMGGDHSYTGGNHLKGGIVSVKKLANQYSETGNLGAITTNPDLFTMEDGAVLSTSTAIENGSAMKMIGEIGGVINNSQDFITARPISGTVLTKKGGGWLKINSANTALERLVITAGVVQNNTTKAAQTVELQGGELRDGDNTSYTIDIPKGKSGKWYMANRRSYGNKITGEGTLTAYCVTEKGSNYYATRTPVNINLTDFEGTLVATSSLDDASKLRFTMNVEGSMAKGTLSLGSTVEVQNSGKTFHFGKVSGSGALGGGCTFSNGTSVGPNTWKVGNDADWSTSVRVRANSNFIKVGSGTITWSGGSDNTGSSTIQEGTLKLAAGGKLGSGTLTVQDGATLMGITSASAPLTNSNVYIQKGATLIVGNSATATSGNMLFGNKNLTISEGAVLEFGVSGATSSILPGCSSIQNIARLTINGIIRLHYPTNGPTLAAGDSIVIWKNVSIVSGTPQLESDVISAEKGLYWDTTDLSKGILRVVSRGATAIGSIGADDNDNARRTVYDVQGTRRPTVRRGLNIVRQADGTTRKMMVK